MAFAYQSPNSLFFCKGFEIRKRQRKVSRVLWSGPIKEVLERDRCADMSQFVEGKATNFPSTHRKGDYQTGDVGDHDAAKVRPLLHHALGGHERWPLRVCAASCAGSERRCLHCRSCPLTKQPSQISTASLYGAQLDAQHGLLERSFGCLCTQARIGADQVQARCNMRSVVSRGSRTECMPGNRPDGRPLRQRCCRRQPRQRSPPRWPPLCWLRPPASSGARQVTLSKTYEDPRLSPASCSGWLRYRSTTKGSAGQVAMCDFGCAPMGGLTQDTGWPGLKASWPRTFSRARARCMAAPAAWARPFMSTARLASKRRASPASNPGTAMSPRPACEGAVWAAWCC